jgi:hypothetical protein
MLFGVWALIPGRTGALSCVACVSVRSAASLRTRFVHHLLLVAITSTS